MTDHISGVLVLQPFLRPGLFRIWFQYTRSDGIIGYSTVPIKDKNTPPMQGHVGPVWDFVRQNPVLKCSPSVRILGPKEGDPDHFHNSGLWENHYVEMAFPYGEGSIGTPEADQVCQQINKLPTKEERDNLIFELRRKMILL